MPRTSRIATTALIGGGATVSGFYGFLIGEAILARKAIGVTDDRPPSPDGLYGDDLPGAPIRVLVIGDSAAVGYGTDRADATPPAMLGIGLAHVMDAPVEIRSRAVVGAKTSDLAEQIDSVDGWEPHVAVIVVGTNDVTHRVSPRTSAEQLGDVVRRLVASDCAVVVGTTPDLGSIRPIMQPLRIVARQISRDLARRQTIAVVEAGGRAVSLADLLGDLFTENRDVMFGADRFHPSETGYANMVSVLVPAVTASLRQRAWSSAYADLVSPQPPRDLMSVRDAAAEASQHAGTQVVQDGGHGGGRWATVLRRRRAG
ncbi:SGNH/GDSL hydrolase family protein [Aeromicrobium sp. SMF47]|uniref:SGNH/GDSL hydrolase family protein n=1 Tax=Aeromicrobium yanjiei TaxID=2662028 RepID=A0A5Q2MME2_9ACTN|nr:MULTISPECIES: SGNH/GDSL hydrolase family protein [Aeromicrobium]MRJ76544.1 SGNH/GDSL hydrolase family protein [Aeromicrobium yanjiei]MRK00894.1 SGNH/GDSL hydrolase family protein [Aeromicrobium sp. S22]QGG42292.1 SGNH/GDSL hydrolase family protein [Aeromicrobium yanjiei]